MTLGGITGSSCLPDAFPGFSFLARCFAEQQRQGGVCQQVTITEVSFHVAPTIFHLLSHQGSEAGSESEEWSPSIRWQAVMLQ